LSIKDDVDQVGVDKIEEHNVNEEEKEPSFESCNDKSTSTSEAYEINEETSDDDFEPNNTVVEVETSTSKVRRSSRKPVSKKMDQYVMYLATEEASTDPIRQAFERVAKNNWREAMREEYNSLLENGTWELCDLPEGKKALRNKWLFKTKKDNNGNIERYKARLVVKGYEQKGGIDYEETYSPVVRYSSIRTLLALATKYDYDVDHLDVVTAFLHGDLKEEIYMQQPKGLAIKGQEQKVCRKGPFTGSIKGVMFGTKS